MDSIKTRGLIIRSTDYGEANRILTVFTEDLGIVSANVYGAKSLKKGLGAASGIFVFGDIMLKDTNGRLRIEEIRVREGFFPLCEDIVKLSLASYFADLAHTAVGDGNRDESVLRLLLNTLYAICYNGVDLELARTVFEFRLAAVGGYLPECEHCVACNTDDFGGELYFDIARGGILCGKCRRADSFKISEAARRALYYILHAEDKKIFSFNASSEVCTLLGAVSERYISEHLERSFKTLEYYKKMLK
ncbi:MAG: DNA repair protein RecO [Clostridia bacterium]|nr:DNA repair protein RecO [Clostridia bacterium]